MYCLGIGNPIRNPQSMIMRKRPGFLPGIFSGGGGAKSIVVQISIVMLTFLLFSDQVLGGRSL